MAAKELSDLEKWAEDNRHRQPWDDRTDHDPVWPNSFISLVREYRKLALKYKALLKSTEQ